MEKTEIAKPLISLDTNQGAENFGNTRVERQNAKSLLNRASGFISDYDFTLNPYQGCQYGCSYCYAAAFSPNQELRQDWGNWVIIKQNASELLKSELTRWQKKHPERPPRIYMSSVTDPYQAIEARQKLTRQLLEIMVDYQPTLVIQTRSPMIVRDVDILQKFQRLRLNMSIPTGSEAVRKDFEPRSPSVNARLSAMGKLRHSIPDIKGHDIRFSITITPLLPTFPEDQVPFITRLQIFDRVVIQPFHKSYSRSLIAGTRQEAQILKQKYAQWYEDEENNYKSFKGKLLSLIEDLREGKEGFSYD